ncbi:MAG: hypothetical protein HOP29_09995 [Phycisphaerales bacterium]|nr:hypothetical protein [Phycisphaerales bacterium]
MIQGPPMGMNMEPPMPGQGGEEGGPVGFSDLRRSVSEVLRVISVRRWMFFAPFCVVTSAAFVLSICVPRRYEAATMFERRDDQVLMNLPLGNVQEPFGIFRRTLLQDVTNPHEAAHVVDAMKLAEFDQEGNAIPADDVAARERRRQALAAKIAGGLDVSLQQVSPHLDVIEIRYMSADPERLTATLDAVRDHYIRMTQGRITTHLRETRDYFDAEHARRLEEVDAIEDELMSFRTDHEGIDPLNPGVTYPQLGDARNRLAALERRGRELAIQLEGEQGLLSTAQRPDGGEASVNPGGVLALSVRGVELSIAYRRMLDEIESMKTVRGMTELHPDVAALRSQMGRIGVEIDEERTAASMVVNGVGGVEQTPAALPRDEGPWGVALSQATRDVRVVENLLAENRREQEIVRGEMAEMEGRRRNAVERRKEYSALQAEANRAREDVLLYERYSDQVGRLLVAEDNQRGILFEKIRPAAGGRRPVSPRVPTVLLLTLLAGLVSGVIMVMLAELLDRTVRTRRQVSRGIGVPILESIDEIVSAAIRRRRFLIRALVVPSVSMVLIAMLLASGSAAYLSLENRAMYERALAVPKEAFERAISGWQSGRPVASSPTDGKEAAG